MRSADLVAMVESRDQSRNGLINASAVAQKSDPFERDWHVQIVATVSIANESAK